MADPKVIIATESVIIQKGVRALMDKLGMFDYREFDDVRRVSRALNSFDPALLIVSSVLLKGEFELTNLLEEHPDIEDKLMILLINESEYDCKSCAQLSLSDTEDAFLSKIRNKLLKEEVLLEKAESNELSTREKAILREIALGKTSKLIAEELYISTHTVVTHRKNINRKLNIKTASGLTVYAILNNIITVEELEQNQ